MLSIKTLCSLLLIVLLSSPSQAGWYRKYELDITPQIIKDSQPRKSSDYKPINITFDHSNINVSDIKEKSQFQYLNETVLAPVQSFLASALKVLPRGSNIIAKPNICNNAVKIPAYASETGYDSDLVIFLELTESASDYDDFVRGAACGLDETTGRPVVGILNFDHVDGWGYLIPIETERRIALTIREIVHILGFQEKLFPYYINPDTLQPLTDHIFNKTVNDVNTLVLDVAPLTQRVRNYFNCPTAEGAYLENQGDNMTMNSHFERRIFGNELMTAGEIFDRRISQFTLALLEGTGWYKVNYDLAEPLTWGKNEGCAFLDTKCIDPVTLKPNFKDFCSPLSTQAVSWNKRGAGFCGQPYPDQILQEEDPALIAAFDYWGNKTIVEDEYSDNCPYYYVPHRGVILTFPQEFDCENVNYLQWGRLPDYEYRGPGSKAFMGTLTQWRKARAYGGYCFKPNCVNKSNGNYEIQVNISSTVAFTCSAAGWINGSNFGSKDIGGEIECPDPNEFCEYILADTYCRGGCYGRGVCSERQCKCQDGWGFGSCVVEEAVR
jgi:hypothetical protein